MSNQQYRDNSILGSSFILDLAIVIALLLMGWILLQTLHNRDDTIEQQIDFISEHDLTEQYNTWVQDDE